MQALFQVKDRSSRTSIHLGSVALQLRSSYQDQEHQRHHQGQLKGPSMSILRAHGTDYQEISRMLLRLESYSNSPCHDLACAQ